MLLDVRELAWSRKPGFSKSSLQKGLAEAGISYVHAKFAGNPKAIRRAASTHRDCLERYSDHLDRNEDVLEEFDRLVMQYVEVGIAVCLLCYERHPEDCHRSILLRAWMEAHARSPKIRHIGQEGTPRLI